MKWSLHKVTAAPDTAVEPVELVNTKPSEMIPRKVDPEAMVQRVLKVLPTSLKAGSDYSFGTW